MTADSLRARLIALIATWRESADGEATSSEWNAAATYHQCADELAALLREPPEVDTALPKRNARELAQALRKRALCLSGQNWELPATVAMMREAADLLERVAAAPEETK